MNIASFIVYIVNITMLKLLNSETSRKYKTILSFTISIILTILLFIQNTFGLNQNFCLKVIDYVINCFRLLHTREYSSLMMNILNTWRRLTVKENIWYIVILSIIFGTTYYNIAMSQQSEKEKIKNGPIDLEIEKEKTTQEKERTTQILGLRNIDLEIEKQKTEQEKQKAKNTALELEKAKVLSNMQKKNKSNKKKTNK